MTRRHVTFSLSTPLRLPVRLFSYISIFIFKLCWCCNLFVLFSTSCLFVDVIVSYSFIIRYSYYRTMVYLYASNVTQQYLDIISMLNVTLFRPILVFPNVYIAFHSNINNTAYFGVTSLFSLPFISNIVSIIMINILIALYSLFS